MTDWNKLVDAARTENTHGIDVRKGKKYTTVAVRVELMRRIAGGLGVETEIVHWGDGKGAPIVVKATIKDESGRILATGHAEEIRGQGQVNTTSALENAETSAIGRALASLGLSGGEFASANEMDGAARKAEQLASAPAYDPTADIDLIRGAKSGTELFEIVKALGDKDTLPAIAAAIIDRLRVLVKGAPSLPALDAFAKAFAKEWQHVKADADARRNELMQEKDAA